jgi:hypothetical protein
MTKVTILTLSVLTLGSIASASENGASKLAQAPPMGWNSYDAFGASVTEQEFLENARYLKEKLLSHGWQYAVVDYRWSDADVLKHGKKGKFSITP